jgi:hypothetical protein
MHFVTKLVLAAPDSNLPSLLTALSLQHFFMKLVLAAPASGLPSLPVALLEHDCAIAEPTTNDVIMTDRAMRLIISS